MVKLTSTGTISWNRLIGGDQEQQGTAVVETADGGFVVVGKTLSGTSGNITGTNKGSFDFLVVKLSSAGAVSWTKILGGSSDESAASVKQTTDGGYIIAGTSSSSASGDITDQSHGMEDGWVVKLDGSGNMAVSYTHPDVYKRQMMRFVHKGFWNMGEKLLFCGQGCFCICRKTEPCAHPEHMRVYRHIWLLIEHTGNYVRCFSAHPRKFYKVRYIHWYFSIKILYQHLCHT